MNPAAEYCSTADIYGDVKVSTGVWKPDKRAVDCTRYVKRCTLNINAKNNNNYAFAA